MVREELDRHKRGESKWKLELRKKLSISMSKKLRLFGKERSNVMRNKTICTTCYYAKKEFFENDSYSKLTCIRFFNIIEDPDSGVICSEWKESKDIEGRKDDQGKLDWTLLPFKTLEGAVKVLMHGAKKYSRDNWKKVPDGAQRYTAALLRHLIDYLSGNRIDEEDGLEHLDHAIANIIFLRWFEDNKRLVKSD
jgi:hypothetical protein